MKTRKRRKMLPNDLKGSTRYWKFKEDAIDCFLWRTLFGTGFGHIFKTGYGIMN